MEKANEGIIRRLMIELRKEAQERRDAAGFAGRFDDGGASGINSYVSAYMEGYYQEIPSEYREKYFEVKELMEKEKDPEYLEYKRLKNKFEEKV